jgi:type III pantothenate kinase
MKKAFADFGNSRIKLLFEDIVFFFDYHSFSELHQFLINNNISQIYYSSVNRSKSDLIINEKFIDAEPLLPKSNINFSSISGMGFDRKIGLIAANNLYDSPLCTIDCGSAITINFLQDRLCLGGFIIPGLGLRYKSLANLDALPDIQASFDDFSIGKTTQEAILIGVLYELCLGIVSIIKKSEQNHNFRLKNIILTGGDAPIIHKCLSVLDFWVILHHNLNLSGIRILSENN